MEDNENTNNVNFRSDSLRETIPNKSRMLSQ